MRIGIIGAGRMGSGLGKLLARAGHEVVYSFSRSREKLERLAAESGHGARASSPADAAAAEVVILTIHWQELETALAQAGNLAGKVVVDVTNPMTESDDELAIGFSTSGGEELARRTGARVVKAFNTIPSELLHAGPARLPERVAVCFCGDDDEAKGITEQLIRDAGFDPVDVGPLHGARYLEPMALLVAQIAYEGPTPEVGYRFVAIPR
jgi:predicted dinucleotide-binding enzyme